MDAGGQAGKKRDLDRDGFHPSFARGHWRGRLEGKALISTWLAGAGHVDVSPLSGSAAPVRRGWQRTVGGGAHPDGLGYVDGAGDEEYLELARQKARQIWHVRHRWYRRNGLPRTLPAQESANDYGYGLGGAGHRVFCTGRRAPAEGFTIFLRSDGGKRYTRSPALARIHDAQPLGPGQETGAAATAGTCGDRGEGQGIGKRHSQTPHDARLDLDRDASTQGPAGNACKQEATAGKSDSLDRWRNSRDERHTDADYRPRSATVSPQHVSPQPSGARARAGQRV